jgi:hypothetical protein
VLNRVTSHQKNRDRVLKRSERHTCHDTICRVQWKETRGPSGTLTNRRGAAGRDWTSYPPPLSQDQALGLSRGGIGPLPFFLPSVSSRTDLGRLVKIDQEIDGSLQSP